MASLLLALVSRLLMAMYFLEEGYSILSSETVYSATLNHVVSQLVPLGLPQDYSMSFVTVFAVCELVFGVLMVPACSARISASVLTVLVLVMNLLTNNFWALNEAHQPAVKAEFMSNIFIVGALLLVCSKSAVPKKKHKKD